MKFIARFESTQLLAIPIDFGTCIISRTVKVVTGPVECTADNSTSLSSVDKLFQNGGLDLNVRSCESKIPSRTLYLHLIAIFSQTI